MFGRKDWIKDVGSISIESFCYGIKNRRNSKYTLMIEKTIQSSNITAIT